MPHRNIKDLIGNQNIVSLPPDATVREAAGAMKAAHVASVVVTAPGDQHLEGIFTERDLTERVVACGLDPNDTRLDNVMTPAPVTIDVDTTVREALRSMHGHGLRHLPIVQDGVVVGVVSMRDFMGEELADMDRERALMDSLTEVL